MAAATVLASCGSLPFITDGDAAVTGTDEAALRAAVDDSIAAFAAGDAKRAASYVDPACGVTPERVATVLVEAEAFVLAFTGLSLEEVYDTTRVLSVSVDGSAGTVTQISDALPSLFETDTEAQLEPSEPEPTESEWIVVDGRWVLPSCAEYLTFDEQEQFGYPARVRFESDGSVVVLESDDAGSETATPELVLETAPATTTAATTTTVTPPPPPPPPPPSTLAPAPSSTTEPTPPSTAAPAPAPAKLDRSLIVASVSNELPATGGLTYGADNLFDGVLETAWNHCGDCTGNSGVGQRVTIGFTQPVTVVGIRIANGYQKEENNVFFTNNRVASLTVRDIEATFSDSLALADAKGWQLFSLPNVTTTGLLLDIDAIYSGTAYPDLAVSEIEVFVLPTP